MSKLINEERLEQLLTWLNDSKSKPFDTNKLEDYVYEMYCDKLDYENAYKYFEINRPVAQHNALGGGGSEGHNIALDRVCSSIRKGNYHGRNYDWKYDNIVDFVVRTPHQNGRYATIGFGGIFDHLTQEFVESGQYSKEYSLVPFKIVDGINEMGLVVNTNVVPETSTKTTGTIPTGELIDTVCTRMLPRYVLDKFATAQEAVDFLQEHVSVFNHGELSSDYHYDIHMMISDINDTFIVEFIDNEIVVHDDKNIMTNFALTNVVFNADGSVYTPATQDSTHDAVITNNIDPHGSGLERYNILNAAYDNISTEADMIAAMQSVKYTNAYTGTTTATKWYTEGVGEIEGVDIEVNSSLEDCEERYQLMQTAYENRDRDTGFTWHTVHSCVYDIANKSVKVIFQEDNNIREFKANEQTQPDWNQNDNTQSDFIKNRICYDSRKTLVPSNIKFVEGGDGKLIGGIGTSGYIYFNPTTPCITGQTYRFSLSNGLYFDVTTSGEPDNSAGGGGGSVSDPSTGVTIGGGVSWNVNGLPDAPNNETVGVSLTTATGYFVGIELFMMIGTEGELHKIDEKYIPATIARASGIYKQGVVSQTQTWTQASDLSCSYVMSNQVTGNIPILFIELVEELGAVFNETSGYFELNGLTDISYNEMKKIYTMSGANISSNSWIGMFRYSQLRTNFFNYPTGTSFGNCTMSNMFAYSDIEVANLIPLTQLSEWTTDDINGAESFIQYLGSLDYIYPATTSSGNVFRTSERIKHIRGIIRYADSSTNFNNVFDYCYSLETVWLYQHNLNTDFSWSPKLKLDTIKFIVNRRSTASTASAFTITLHPTTYATCQADTSEYTYSGQTYTGIIAYAAARNISIASA